MSTEGRLRGRRRHATARMAWWLAITAVASASGATAQDTSVWYRSSGTCPEGSRWLERLAARGVAARLAQVGDRIDFVVTLGPDAEGRHAGVLQRQSEAGVVTIRTVTDADCALVADAIALSLTLAQHGDVNEGEPVRGPDATPTEPATERAEPVAPTPAEAPRARIESAPPKGDRPPPTTVEDHLAWSIDGAGLLQTGSLPAPLWGGRLGLGVAWQDAGRQGVGWPGQGFVHPNASLSLLAAAGATDLDDQRARARLLAVAFGTCPLRLSLGDLGIYPCLGAQLGQLRIEAEGPFGRADTGVWFALELGLAASLQLFGPVSLRAGLHGVLPINRFELEYEGGRRYRTPGLAARAEFGASVRFP